MTHIGRLWMVSVAAGALALGGCGSVSSPYNPAQAYYCGGKTVTLVDTAAGDAIAKPLWTWTAKESPQIEHPAAFTGLNDCRPALGGGAILVSSSVNGGIAMIRRSDKACLFYARGRNAHGMELIGPDIAAGAFSLKTDEVRVYDLRKPALDAEAIWSMPLPGAHALVWDARRNVLWALGTDDLAKIEVVRRDDGVHARELGRLKLPGRGGHDVFPFDADRLAVSAWEHCYLFDCRREAFSLLTALADAVNVKSLNRHPTSGLIMFTQGEGETNYSDLLKFVPAAMASPATTSPAASQPARTLRVPTKDLYRARWNMPRPM